MQPESREHYCSYCLRLLERDDELCSRPSCARPRPSSGWSYFYDGGENIDGRFRIRNRLGVGGAGVTYRAIDLAAEDPEHRDVAIKILHKDRYQGILRDRLRLEGEVLRRFHHPNIVSFRGLKVEGGEPYYLATGFVAGGSLDEFLRDVRRLSARTVLQVGAQIARALASAHAIGVTHRDLKPSNILVRDRAEYPLQIRVADWGIARAVPEFIPRKHVTIQGGFVGTPEFASPEQLRGEASVGPPTDIFGLGVLMHSLAGGQPVRDLVARGAVDYRSLREGASRYERLPLTSDGNNEPHLPLLDELVDQLITRTPEARPNAETVAAYCEELIEAGDTTPKSGKQLSPLPELVPAAAFETPKEELFLPPDGDKAPPLQLSGETQERKAPTTVEMAEPPTPSGELERGDTMAMESDSNAGASPAAAATLAAPAPTAAVADETPDCEKPWPVEQDAALSTPTAVPEEMESLPAMDVLKPSSAPTAPVMLNEPKPSLPGDPTLLRDIAPILERDDEPARQRTWWPLVAVGLVLAVVAGVAASPAVRATWSSRLDSLFAGETDPLAGGNPAPDLQLGIGMLSDGGIHLSPGGRRLGLPTPARSDKRRMQRSKPEVEAVETPEVTTPAKTASAPAKHSPRSTRSVSPKQVATQAKEAEGSAETAALEESAAGSEAEAAESASAPQEGFVIDHGTVEEGAEKDSGPRSKSRPIWSRRPGAPRVGSSGYKTSRKKEASAGPKEPPKTDPPPPPDAKEEEEEEEEQTGPGAKFHKKD